MVDDDSELISIYYGAEIKEEDAKKLTERLEECYPMLDVELNQGDSRFIIILFLWSDCFVLAVRRILAVRTAWGTVREVLYLWG